MNKRLFTENANGLTFLIKVTPKAKQNKIGDISKDDKDRFLLKAYVTAAAIDGKANEAIITLFAKSWHLKKSQLEIKMGLTSKNKVVQIKGDPTELLVYLEKIL